MVIYINHFNKDICDTLEELGYTNNCNIPLVENNKYGILLFTITKVFCEFIIGEENKFDKDICYNCRNNEMEFIKLAIEYYESKDFKSSNFI